LLGLEGFSRAISIAGRRIADSLQACRHQSQSGRHQVTRAISPACSLPLDGEVSRKRGGRRSDAVKRISAATNLARLHHRVGLRPVAHLLRADRRRGAEGQSRDAFPRHLGQALANLYGGMEEGGAFVPVGCRSSSAAPMHRWLPATSRPRTGSICSRAWDRDRGVDMAKLVLATNESAS